MLINTIFIKIIEKSFFLLFYNELLNLNNY